MTAKIQDQLESEDRAREDLERIERLVFSESFQHYFMRRLSGKIKDQQDIMNDPSTSDEQTLEAKKIKGILEGIARMPQEDAIGCRSILGLEPDENPISLSPLA